MTVPVAAADPVCGHPDFWLADVVLRLARDDERREWDQLMDTQHYLGFRQFAGRGLRYVAEWHGRWLALLGWQTGVFQCAPRDKWIGWHKGVQMPRLHLCANNTRFLILPAAAGVKNLGSYVLGANLRRLSADWERNWGHPLLLAEAFVEMRRYKGSVYLAANWIPVGVTKGYARSNGKYTNKHGVKKKMLVYPLQAGARELLRDPQERAEWNCEAVRVQYSQAELASLRELLEEVPDARKARGLRHPLGAVLALLVLALLAGRHGGRAAEKFCKQLPQRDLRVLRCRFNPLLRRYEAPSDTTFQRALAEVEAGTLERVIQRWTQPRCGRKPRALAGDGKRIRGANRMAAEGLHWETVTLVDATGLPVASRSYGDGEPAALRALLEEVDLRGVTVTLDAGASYWWSRTGRTDRHQGQRARDAGAAAGAGLARCAAHQPSLAQGPRALGVAQAGGAGSAGTGSGGGAAALPARAPGAARDAPHEDEQARRGDRGSAVRDHVAAARPGRGAAAADAAPRALAGGEFQSLLARHDVPRGRQPHAHGACAGEQRGAEQPRAGDRGAAAGAGRDGARDADAADGAAREGAGGDPESALRRGPQAGGTAPRSAPRTGSGGSEGAAGRGWCARIAIPRADRARCAPVTTCRPRERWTMLCPRNARPLKSLDPLHANRTRINPALEALAVGGVQQDTGGGFQGERSLGLALGAGASRQAGEALLAEDAVDDALGRGILGGGVEAGLDVGDGEVALAQGDDLVADFESGGAGRAAATGRGEEEGRGGVIEVAEVAGESVDRGGGVAELTGDLAGGAAFEEERAQQFVAALASMGGTGEEVSWGRQESVSN